VARAMVNRLWFRGLGLTSFDLAELTVNIEAEFDVDIFEDGLVNTIGEIYEKLQK
ncbi:MAG: hypothetical protein IKA35_01360, partial [Bacteroidaceae bacterium]|nr:hypothetical protein [Bacteroidaceae bacterium]